jgi:hypothetical protein
MSNSCTLCVLNNKYSSCKLFKDCAFSVSSSVRSIYCLSFIGLQGLLWWFSCRFHPFASLFLSILLVFQLITHVFDSCKAIITDVSNYTLHFLWYILSFYHLTWLLIISAYRFPIYCVMEYVFFQFIFFKSVAMKIFYEAQRC